MPQGDQKDLKARVALREKILKLTKEIQKLEDDIAKSIESQGQASEDVVKKHAAAKKTLDKAQKDFTKGSKKVEKATKGNAKAAEEWANVITDKVGKAQKDAQKQGKTLSDNFINMTGTVANMGKKLIEATNDKGTAKVLEDFHGWSLELEKVNAGLEEMSGDKLEKIQKQQREAMKTLKKSGKFSKDNMKTIGNMYKPIDKAKQATSKAAEAGKNFSKHLTTSKGRANLLAVAVSAVGAAMEKVAGSAEKIQQSLGTSSKTSIEMAFSWKKIGLSILGFSEPLSDARRELSLAASDITMMDGGADKLARNMTWVSRNTGTATKTLAEMGEILMLTTDLSREQSHLMIMGLEGFVKAAGGIPKEVFDDIATSAEEIATWTDGSADSIARAATMANKLGINLKTASSSANKFLNLESSIAAEFEASVLLGRELNLDKARTLALNNDLEGVMREIVNQVGTEAEFQQMNAIERQALAEAVGMSTEDLSKMIGYGAEGGGEVDKTLKIQKSANKGIWEIVTQLTPGRFGKIISMFTKGLTAVIGYTAIKGGVMAALKTAGMNGTVFLGTLKANIIASLKTWWKGTKVGRLFTWFGEKIINGFKMMKGWIFEPFKWLSTKLNFSSFTTLTTRLGTFLKPLTAFLGSSGPIVRGLGMLKPFLSKISGWLAPLFDIFQTFFGKGAGDTEAGAAGMSFGAAGAGIGALLAPFTGGMSIIAGYAIGSIVGHLVNHFFPAVGKKIVEWANTVGGWFKDAWGWASDVGSNISQKFADAKAATGRGIQIGKDAINAWNESYPVWKADMIQSFKDTWNSMGESIVATVGDIWDAIWLPIEDMSTAIVAKVKTVMDFDALGWVGKKWDQVDLMPDWLKDDAKKHDDFIWRSGQGVAKFNKDDNLMGIKDPEALRRAGSDATSSSMQNKQALLLSGIIDRLAPLDVIATKLDKLDKLDNLKVVEST